MLLQTHTSYMMEFSKVFIDDEVNSHLNTPVLNGVIGEFSRWDAYSVARELPSAASDTSRRGYIRR